MKTKRFISLIIALVLSLTIVGAFTVSVAAETDSVDTVGAVATEAEQTAEAASDSSVLSAKAMAAAIAVGIACAAGAIGMALAIAKSAESMARQPEMADKINSAMMLGLVFIETAIIYALIIAILVIFVL